jgi:RHS repeat-associated protein
VKRTLTYSPGGALTQDAVTAGATYNYGYDARKRVVSAGAVSGDQGTYGYDYQGRRVWRTVTGSSSTTQTHYVFDQAGRLLAEHDGATGAVLREYVWLDDMPVAMIDSTGTSPATYYIHTGQIEEPLVMTDGSQTKVWDAYVEPFGSATVFGTPSAGLDLRLPGQFTQAETGALSQNWNRDYDTSLGRYIEADPLGIDAGQNVYGYVDGDPLNVIDPEGLVQHVTGQTIDCGRNCWIRIDYTFDPSTGVKTRHLHWGCKGKSGECGENGKPSHGGTWDDAPENIKDCARRHGFNGQSSTSPLSSFLRQLGDWLNSPIPGTGGGAPPFAPPLPYPPPVYWYNILR